MTQPPQTPPPDGPAAPPPYGPYWPAPGAPYPPSPPQVPYSAPTNTYAVVSLILALAVFPPLGIYFGNKAKQQIAQTGERGIELARAGVICGWILTTLMVVWCGFTGLLMAQSGA